ncbi:MAG: hypothetical protein OIF55_19195 [Amphritea sp.]|nr:hypothetical protein [Amphritea sp.]
MKAAMIDILEGFIWLVALLLVVAGGAGGFIFGMGDYRPDMGQGAMFGALGGLVGLCAAAIFCGPMFVLLQMRECLEDIRSKG